MTKTKKTAVTYYKFEDGYFCWTAGKLSKSERVYEVLKHGKIIIERKEKS